MYFCSSGIVRATSASSCSKERINQMIEAARRIATMNCRLKR